MHIVGSVDCGVQIDLALHRRTAIVDNFLVVELGHTDGLLTANSRGTIILTTEVRYG